jgi:hypothetical protein
MKNNGKPKWSKLVANILLLLGRSILSIPFILYFLGIYGVIKGMKKGDDEDVNFYTVILGTNLIMVSFTIWLIIKLA